MTSHLLFLSVPGLRPRDIDAANTPTLHGWANRGVITELIPTFPCVTSCVQASMFTGTGPGEHGIIANGFFYQQQNKVEMWTGWNNLVQRSQIWDTLRARGLTSAVWHAQNIKGAVADFIVTPAPIHDADGSTKLWCYSKPDGLYQQLIDDLGHFPLQHYWGPLSNIESTRWILRAAVWLIERHAPNFHWIYIPHLDYAMQKFGPNCPQARAALAELDRELAAFAERIASLPIGRDTVFIVAGEYAMTEVSAVVYPNRILRDAHLLALEQIDGREHLNLANSQAFALVDHQFAHIFLTGKQRSAIDNRQSQMIAQLFRDEPGVSAVYVADDRAKVGMNHPRAGDLILVCDDAHWLGYYWWQDDAKAPSFARTVDIHNKPGYDPVELFFDPQTRGIPLDAKRVKGSHGVPATAPHHRTALICSSPPNKDPWPKAVRDTDLCSMVKGMFVS